MSEPSPCSRTPATPSPGWRAHPPARSSAPWWPRACRRRGSRRSWRRWTTAGLPIGHFWTGFPAHVFGGPGTVLAAWGRDGATLLSWQRRAEVDDLRASPRHLRERRVQAPRANGERDSARAPSRARLSLVAPPISDYRRRRVDSPRSASAVSWAASVRPVLARRSVTRGDGLRSRTSAVPKGRVRTLLWRHHRDTAGRTLERPAAVVADREGVGAFVRSARRLVRSDPWRSRLRTCRRG